MTGTPTSAGFAGFEPTVGEIRAVRTFRVGPGGVLYPLFSDVPWQDGDNEARCRPDAAGPAGHDRVPDPDCSCGFYAYSDERAAREFPQSRHVLAVVACWGRVIAGTRGLRCEHARIEALWLSPAVPAALADAVRARYPSAAPAATRESLLAEHPPDVLDCYEPQPRTAIGVRVAAALAVAAAETLGLVPRAVLLGTAWGAPLVTAVVVGLLAGALVGTVPGTARRSEHGTARRRLACVALALWVLAPLAGVAGTVLVRLPLGLVLGLGALHRWGEIRRAARFPAAVLPASCREPPVRGE